MSFLELLEAEGRVAKKNAETLTRRFLLMYFGAAFLFCAAIAATAAAYMWLREYLCGPLSALAVSAILLAAGWYLFSRARVSDETSQTSELPVVASAEDKADGR